ncbi:MAG: AarF/ABC1/UbiB kinase family protein [Pseudomonadota bacterium]
MNNHSPLSRPLPIPARRISRLAGFGRMATGIAGEVALNRLRAVAAGESVDYQDLLLTPSNAARLADQLAKMRGAAMKMGQLLSMDAGEFIAPELAQILARLRAEGHYMPPSQLKKVLTAAWGADWLKSFRKFDVRPIAAASIGQVHRAQTRDGRDIALKVQYPGVRSSIDSDISNLAALIRLSGLIPREIDLSPLLEEARNQLHEEADYAREGRYLDRFSTLLAQSDDFAVPKLHADLTGTDVLAMDYLPGVPIEDLSEAPQQVRDGVIARLIDLVFRELFEFRLMQTDPNFANYLYDSDRDVIVLLDFGAARELDEGLVGSFRRLLQTARSGDRPALEKGMIDLGFFDETAKRHHIEALVDMGVMALEPIAHGGTFDFADQSFVQRLHKAGHAFGKERDFWHFPPTEVMLVQRKLAGLYLLGARLKARIDLDPLLDRFV